MKLNNYIIIIIIKRQVLKITLAVRFWHVEMEAFRTIEATNSIFFS
jgi:hypothetical protein